MGYDLERFVCYVNEGLLCGICHNVLLRPLQAPCEHAFCSACISNWLLDHNTCPEDRQPLDVDSLKPLYRYMRNDLNRLEIRCVNANRGCEVVCKLENLHTHEEDCDFVFVSSSNVGMKTFSNYRCPTHVEKRSMEAHLSECKFCTRKCPSGCILRPSEQSRQNCVAELHTEIKMLRTLVLLLRVMRHLLQQIVTPEEPSQVGEGRVVRTCAVHALRAVQQELEELETEVGQDKLQMDPLPTLRLGPTCELLRKQRREASIFSSNPFTKVRLNK
ncbi:RING finger protein 151 isoform X2 [Corythoichthys intestinalis]|nr:RING finger protein 151 isoform X2 [Corythoichthys intestinalis]